MTFQLFFRSSDYPSQEPSNFEAVVNPPITLSTKYEGAIVGGSVVNTTVNVSAGLGNNALRFSSNGADWFTVTFPSGTYQTANIQTELQNAMLANGHSTTVNGVVLYPINFSASIYLSRVQFTLNAGYYLDLTVSSLNQLLGFNSQTYHAGGSATTFTAQNPALFTNYGSFYYVICDGVDGGIDAGENIGKGLIKVVEGNELGFAISLTDASGDYAYFPLKGSRLDRIRFKVLDNRGNIANFNGEQTAFLMKFRPLS